MSATLSLQFQLKGIVNGDLIQWPTSGLYAPVSFTTSTDIVYKETAAIANTTVTELLTIGSGSDVASSSLIVLIPTVACVFNWTLSSDANNHSAGCRANWPFFLSTGQSVPYNATSSTAVSGAAASITKVQAYQSSGGAGFVHIFTAA